VGEGEAVRQKVGVHECEELETMVMEGVNDEN